METITQYLQHIGLCMTEVSFQYTDHFQALAQGNTFSWIISILNPNHHDSTASLHKPWPNKRVLLLVLSIAKLPFSFGLIL